MFGRLTRLNCKLHGQELKELKFYGGFLLTSPLEDFTRPAHENLSAEAMATLEVPPPATSVTTQNVTPGYGAINQTSSSTGYSSGAELQQLPRADSSPHPRSSDSSRPSSSNASSQQGTASSSSQPLLGHHGQSEFVTKRKTQHRNNDSTI